MTDGEEIGRYSMTFDAGRRVKSPPPRWLLTATLTVALLQLIWFLVAIRVIHLQLGDSAIGSVFAYLLPLLSPVEIALSIVCLVMGRAVHRTVAIVCILCLGTQVAALVYILATFRLQGW